MEGVIFGILGYIHKMNTSENVDRWTYLILLKPTVLFYSR